MRLAKDLKTLIFPALLVFFLFNLGVGLGANSFYSEWPFPVGVFAILVVVIAWGGLDAILPRGAVERTLLVSLLPLLFFGVSFLLAKSSLWRDISMAVSVFLWGFVLVWDQKEVNAFVKRHLDP